MTMSEREIEQSLSEQAREKYSEKELTGDERREALAAHHHHLVRDTESQVTFHPDVADGIESEVTVTVPDTYCFTCEEWIGVSGLDLTGTPRSSSEAYYLNGPPEAVNDLQNRVQDTVTDLAGTVIDTHPDIETPAEAATFITTEIEQIKDQLVAEPNNSASPPDTESAQSESGVTRD